MSLDPNIDDLRPDSSKDLFPIVPLGMSEMWNTLQAGCRNIATYVRDTMESRQEGLDFVNEHRTEISREELDEFEDALEGVDEVISRGNSQLDEFGDIMKEEGWPIGDCQPVPPMRPR